MPELSPLRARPYPRSRMPSPALGLRPQARAGRSRPRLVLSCHQVDKKYRALGVRAGTNAPQANMRKMNTCEKTGRGYPAFFSNPESRVREREQNQQLRKRPMQVSQNEHLRESGPRGPPPRTSSNRSGLRTPVECTGLPKTQMSFCASTKAGGGENSSMIHSRPL